MRRSMVVRMIQDYGCSRIWTTIGCFFFIIPLPFVLLGSSAQDVPAEMICPRGSVWKYLDDGSNQGTAWREREFDDAAWSAGPAELGYGDGGEDTRIRFGPSSNDKFPTTYFRKSFSLDAELLGRSSAVEFELLVDDGAIVYLNGRAVHRVNLKPDPGYLELAFEAVSGDAEKRYHSFQAGAQLLTPGRNTIAVEVHQSDADSSDLSFDLSARLLRPEYALPETLLRTHRTGIGDVAKLSANPGRDVIVAGERIFPALRINRADNAVERRMTSLPFLGTHLMGIADLESDQTDDLLYIVPEGQQDAGSLALLAGFDDGTPKRIILAAKRSEEERLAGGVQDLDGDGMIDVVITRDVPDGAGPDLVLLRRNLGNLDFGAEQILLDVGDLAPWRVFPGSDLNGDGRSDLLVGLVSSVNRYLQREGGGFSSRSVLATLPGVSINSPYQAVDLNGDGRSDVVVLDGFLLGNSVGRLTALRSVPGVDYHLSAHDKDGDGDSDLIVSEGDYLKWYLNDGSGTFSPGPIIGDTGRCQSVRLADMDGDGVVDILAHSVDRGILLLRGVPPTSPVISAFGASGSHLTEPGEITLEWSVAGADRISIQPRPGAVSAKGMAQLDVESSTEFKITATGGGKTVTATTRVSVAPFHGEQPEVRLPQLLPARVVSGDVSNDGLEDLLFIEGEQLIIYSGQPGGLDNPLNKAWDSAGFTIDALAVREVNGDGIPDLLITSRGSEAWVEQTQAETFTRAARFPDMHRHILHVHDYDGDGDLDAIYVDQEVLGEFLVSEQIDGSFQELRSFEFPGRVNGDQLWVDADDDGDPDLIGSTPEGVFLFPMQNDRPTGEKVPILVTFDDFLDFDLTDMDQSGSPHLVMSSRNWAGTFVVPLDNAALTGEPPLLVAQFPIESTFGVEITDINGDGLPDLLDSAFLNWMRNEGNLGFAAEAGIPEERRGRFSGRFQDVFHDFDGDGDRDYLSYSDERAPFWLEHHSGDDEGARPKEAVITDVGLAGDLRLSIEWRSLATSAYRIESSLDLLSWTDVTPGGAPMRGDETGISRLSIAFDEGDRAIYVRVVELVP